MVEGFERFPRGSAPHVEPAGNLVRVEGVHRLAQQEHDVVGHVRRRVDGAHAGEHELALQPVGGWSRGVDALHLAQAEASSVGVGVEGDLEKRSRRRGHGRGVNACDGGVARGVGVAQAESRGDLAGQAAGGQGVAAIGRDVDVEDRVVEAEVFAHVLAWGAEALREGDDALATGGQAQLGGGGHHAL